MFNYEINKYTNEENDNYKEEKNKGISATPYRDEKMSVENMNQEDSTKYGEFVSSYFGWMTLDNQKRRASELENMTKRNKKLEK